MPIADLVEIVENTAIPLGLVAGLLALLATRSGRKVLRNVFRKGKPPRAKGAAQPPQADGREAKP